MTHYTSLPKEMRKGRLVRKKGNKPGFALHAELFRITGTTSPRLTASMS